MKVLLLIFALLVFTISAFSQSPQPLRIGFFADLSGQTSMFGEATKMGFSFAVDEINRAGGVNGRKFELFIRDDEGRPEMARKVVAKLIKDDKAHVIIGEVASTNSLAAAFIAQLERVPMITPASTNTKVTEVGNYIFRACFVDPLQGEAMANFAFSELKARRIAILGDANSDYAKALSTTFIEKFRSLGGKIVMEESYQQRDPDYSAQLRRIKRTKPDAIYLPGYYGEVGLIAKQVRKLGITIPLLGGDGWDSPELWKLGGAALNNSYISNHYAADEPTPEVKSFVEKFRAVYKTEPDSLAALAYDTAYLLADAVRRAKSIEGNDLRDAVAETTSIRGVTSDLFTFDSNRNPRKPVRILKLDPKNRKFVFHKTITP